MQGSWWVVWFVVSHSVQHARPTVERIGLPDGRPAGPGWTKSWAMSNRIHSAPGLARFAPNDPLLHFARLSGERRDPLACLFRTCLTANQRERDPEDGPLVVDFHAAQLVQVAIHARLEDQGV